MKKFSAIFLAASSIFFLAQKSLAVPSDGTTTSALLRVRDKIIMSF
jgi:hypothetical protein